MMDARWTTLLEAARAAHAAVPALQDFCPFPEPLREQAVTAHHDPLCDAMAADADLTTEAFAGFRDALIAAGPLAQWRETYRHTSIGAVLHAHFGTYEFLGHDAPFGTDTMRGFMVYQRPGYHYPMHHHPAEELYLVLAGEAEFHVEGEGSRVLRPGESQFHLTNQPHALTTHDQPVLAYVLWRGDLMTKPVFTYPEALG
ncbi:cupin domain-containing protein [Roseovarius faecimaris]|uniref:Cupin domain-containing protein n=1 Tax=Roseovarius faecimaris TaxID=2494550 RepID=A0A6I6ITK0_9RHOB|nr:dimethylsulfonioproprionate lyase family protein [Roseovarius faecimaris]QGX98817.1 cupin domain-containing protein [Roseovarius faecimaris]